jgi:hypothetical protein
MDAWMTARNAMFAAQHPGDLSLYEASCVLAINNAVASGRATPLVFGNPPMRKYAVQLDPNDFNSGEDFSRLEEEPYPTWIPTQAPPPTTPITLNPTGNSDALTAIQATLSTIETQVAAILAAVTKS